MTFDEFNEALASLPPIQRAQVLVEPIAAMPVGSQLGTYQREAGANRWRCDYQSTKRKRDGSMATVTHSSITGAWSVAVDVGFCPQHRAKEMQEIVARLYLAMAEAGPDAFNTLRAAAPQQALPLGDF